MSARPSTTTVSACAEARALLSRLEGTMTRLDPDREDPGVRPVYALLRIAYDRLRGELAAFEREAFHGEPSASAVEHLAFAMDAARRTLTPDVAP